MSRFNSHRVAADSDSATADRRGGAVKKPKHTSPKCFEDAVTFPLLSNSTQSGYDTFELPGICTKDPKIQQERISPFLPFQPVFNCNLCNPGTISPSAHFRQRTRTNSSTPRSHRLHLSSGLNGGRTAHASVHKALCYAAARWAHVELFRSAALSGCAVPGTDISCELQLVVVEHVQAWVATPLCCPVHSLCNVR
eukprot:1764573-Rhodomonas_salina.2